MKKYNKMLKKLNKVIKKEFGIKNMDVRLDDSIVSVAERIAMRIENCNLEQVYDMRIGSVHGMDLHLPGWVAIAFVIEFCDLHKVNQNSTIKEMFDEAI